MRHCENEVVDVYEAHGPNLADLLRDAADEVERHGNGDYVNIYTAWLDDGYIVTAYFH